MILRCFGKKFLAPPCRSYLVRILRRELHYPQESSDKGNKGQSSRLCSVGQRKNVVVPAKRESDLSESLIFPCERKQKKTVNGDLTFR